MEKKKMKITEEFLASVGDLTSDCHNISRQFGKMKVDVGEVDLLKIARAFSALGAAASEAASQTLSAQEIKAGQERIKELEAKAAANNG